jgi:putative ABC transport system substrate-binding protein
MIVRGAGLGSQRPYRPGMDRRRFLLTSLASALAAPLAAEGQPTGRVPHLAYVVPGPPTCGMNNPVAEAFQQVLSEFGYVPGRTIRWDRHCFQMEEGISELITGLVRQKPDVILVVGTPSALAAKAATSTIPIVFAGAGDPVESGLVNNLANPGGNITGISNNQRELTHKRFELFRQVIPAITRVAVLLDPALALAPVLWRDAEDAARTLRMRLVRLDARTGAEIETAFQGTAKAGVQAVLVMGSGTFWVERTRIARLTSQHRLPSMLPTPAEVEAGGLMSYGADPVEIFRSAGRYVGKILQGANPARLPVEQPTKFNLVINLKTAKALGLTIPPSLLARADQVIE